MIKFLLGILKILLIILIAGISYHYVQLHQDGELVGADHPKEIGKAAGKTAKGMKQTAIDIKESKRLKDLKDTFSKEYFK